MVQEHIFDTGEIQLNYAEGGTKGKPIMVFLHGLTGRWQAYNDAFDEYCQDWHLYAPDLRGHGNSSKPPEGYRYTVYAMDIIAFLQKVVRKPVVLVGHSLGAHVTLAVAHLASESVRALIAIDPPKLGDDIEIADYPFAKAWFSWVYETVNNKPSFEQVMVRCKAFNPEANQVDLQAMAKRVFGVAPGAVRAALDETNRDGYDLQGALRSIRCPVLLLYGDFTQGSVVRDKDAENFKQLVPQAVIAKIPNGNHRLWWEQAETRRRHVQIFLDSIR